MSLKALVAIEGNIGYFLPEVAVGEKMRDAEIDADRFGRLYVGAHRQSTVFRKVNGQAGADQFDSILETQRLEKRQDELPLSLVIPTLERPLGLLRQFLRVRVFDAILTKDLPPTFGPFVPDRRFSKNARQRQKSALRVV
jgi:hypothetical protein